MRFVKSINSLFCSLNSMIVFRFSPASCILTLCALLFSFQYNPLLASQNASAVSSENYYRPTMYQPLLIVDCGRKQTVFSKTCFRAIDKLSRKVRASGKFTSVYSISTYSFLYESKHKVFPANLEKFHPYKNSKMALFLKKRYPVQMKQLTGAGGKYAVIYVEKTSKKIEEKDRDNWAEYAHRKKIRVSYFYEPEFKKHFKKYFLGLYLIVKIDYPEKLSEKNLFLRMQKLARALYKLPYVKQIYSPWHSKQALTSLATFKNTNKFKNLWELTGNEASRTWDVKRNVVYLLLFSRMNKKINDNLVYKVLKKFHKRRKAKWIVYGQNYKILQKTVDDLNRDKGLVSGSAATKKKYEKINNKLLEANNKENKKKVNNKVSKPATK